MFVSQITYVLVPARRQATWGRHSESCLLLGRFEFKAPPGKDWNVENLNPLTERTAQTDLTQRET